MQLLTISEKTKRDGVNVGDIVGIFPDTHIFSTNEYDIFTVVSTDMTEEEINLLRPVREMPVEGVEEERPLFELNYLNGEITVNG